MNNMEIPVQLPFPQLRTGGLFFDVATPLDLGYGGRDRTGVGVVHVPFGCDPMFVGPSEACSTSDVDGIDTGASGLEPKDAAIRDYPDQVTHPAFKVVDGLRCSSISLPNAEGDDATLSDRLTARMRLQLSKMAMAELVSGDVSGGPALVDGTALAASASMSKAAIAIESWLASVLHNGLGVVIIPIGLVAAAREAGWVDWSTMATVTGHRVIADAGFTGNPADPTNGIPSSFTVFGMGVPAFAATSPHILDVASGAHVSITDNVMEQISEAYVQVAFDPCAVAKTVVSV